MKTAITARQNSLWSTPERTSAPRVDEKSAAKKTAARKPTAKAATPSKGGASAAQSATVKTATTKSATAKSATAKTSVQKTTSPRATKKRAPKDLALQYGEKTKAPRASAAKAAPRKRRDAAARARLQQVIAPDEGVLQRLARAGSIASSLAPIDDNGHAIKIPGGKSVRRSHKWETRCGKCGANGKYAASAALCGGCGAILVRE